MNVLIVHPCKGFYGGAEEVVVQLTNYLTAGGHKVFLVTRNAPVQLHLGVKDISRVTPFETRSWFVFRRSVRDLLERADVVNVHNAPAPLMTFPKRVPTVYMCNEPMELFTSWWRKPIEAFNRWWVRKSGMRVVVADKANAQRFFGLYGVEPVIIPYGVDYEFWSQPTGVCKPKDSRVRILHVGTITPYKNQLKSIVLLTELLSHGVDAELTFAGRPADYKYWAKLLQDYIPVADKEVPGLAYKIKWLGQCTREQVRALFRQHDVLYHPVEGQGGWLVPFEAMCAGLPVIVEPSFSAWHLIKVNGLGIAINEMTGPAAKVIASEEYKKLDTEAIRSWVEENLTWKKFGERMVKIFEEAIHERARAS